MFDFRKISCALLSCYLRFEIGPNRDMALTLERTLVYVNYQVKASWVYGIFEGGLILDSSSASSI